MVGLDLHFDISPPPRQVANFIFNHIKDPNWLATYLNAVVALPPPDGIVLTQTQQVLPINNVNDSMFGPVQFVNPATTFTSMIPLNTPGDYWTQFARILVQGLSTPQICFVCGHMSTISVGTPMLGAFSEAGGQVVLGELVIQTYATDLDARRIVAEAERLE